MVKTKTNLLCFILSLVLVYPVKAFYHLLSPPSSLPSLSRPSVTQNGKIFSVSNYKSSVGRIQHVALSSKNLTEGNFSIEEIDENKGKKSFIMRLVHSRFGENGAVAQWVDFGQRHAKAFVLVFFLAEYFEFAIKLSKPIFTGSHHFFHSIPVESSLNSKMFTANLLQPNRIMFSLKLLFAYVFACPFQIFVFERLNTKYGWSKNRSFLTISGLGLLVIISYFSALFLTGCVAESIKITFLS